jgi:hypothetical protein
LTILASPAEIDELKKLYSLKKTPLLGEIKTLKVFETFRV